MTNETPEISLLKNSEFILDSSLIQKDGSSSFYINALDPSKPAYPGDRFMFKEILFKDLEVEIPQGHLGKNRPLYKTVLKVVNDYSQQNGNERALGIWVKRRPFYVNSGIVPEYDYHVYIHGGFLRNFLDIALSVNFTFQGFDEKKIKKQWCSLPSINESKQLNFSHVSKTPKHTCGDTEWCNLHITRNYESIGKIIQGIQTVRLRFKLSMSLKLKQESLVENSPLDLMKLCPEMILQTLFENESTKDVTFITEGQNETKCHKCILAAQSQFLDAMLTTQLSERESAIIRLDDISTEGLTHLANYLYGKSVPAEELDSVVVLELFQAAHKYKLSQLEKDSATLFLSKEDARFLLTLLCKFIFFTKNMDGYKKLNKHVVSLMARMPSAELRSSEKFCELPPNDALDLTLKLMDELNLLSK